MKTCADSEGMNTHRIVISGLLAVFFSISASVSALDLSKFQNFLSVRRPEHTRRSRSFRNIRTANSQTYSNDYSSLNADASYQNNSSNNGIGTKMVTLGGNRRLKDGERFLLPADTKVPKELRPLLTERKTPRQGLSFAGGTGAMLVPSPGVLEPGKAAVSVHAMSFDLYNVNNNKIKGQDYFDTAVCVAYGSQEGYEISLDKTFANQDQYSVAEPMYFNAKYQIPGNLTIGGSFCLDSQAGYNSLWISTGVPVAWVGIGTNFGASDYKFNYNGYDKLKRAKFGGYNYDYSTGTGYADPVFFMVGGAIPLNDNLRFLYDFNGDKFSLGFRFNYAHTLYLDASYVSDGDYENLPGAIAHKKTSNFIFGGSIAY